MGFYSILRTPDRIDLMAGCYSDQHSCQIGEQNDIKVEFVPSEAGLKIMVTGNETRLTFVKCRWYGRFDEDTRFLGDAVERSYGNLQFMGLCPERVMPWYFVASTGREHAGYGVRVRPDTMVSWQTDAFGTTLWLDFRCGTRGYQLKGQTLEAAELVEIHGSEELADFMHQFCIRMAKDPIFPDHPVYGFNNWYYAYGKTSQEQVLQDSAALAELTRDLENRPYMVLDDGWQEGVTLKTVTNERFPDMKAMTERMKQLRVRPGIWYRPLLAGSHCPELRNDVYKGVLDPSLDETLAVIAADVERITGDWGFELIKYDFATYDFFHGFYADGRTKVDGPNILGLVNDSLQLTREDWTLRRSMTNAQALKRLYKTIYDHANGAVIIGCNCIGHLGCGYFHLHRSGDDTSGREWERTRVMGVNCLAFRLCQHKAFFHVDADCIGCTGSTNYTWDDARPWLNLLTDSSTPLFVSIPADRITPEIGAELAQCLCRASRQDGTCKPLNLLNTTSPVAWEINGERREYALHGPMGTNMYIL